MKQKRWNSLGRVWLTVCLVLSIIGIACQPKLDLSTPSVLSPKASFSEKVEHTLELARYKLYKTLQYIEKTHKKILLYPTYTENHRLKTQKNQRLPDGFYHLESSKFWAAGAFPGLLWHLYHQEADLHLKHYWKSKAQDWSWHLYPRTQAHVKDMAMNNLFVFRPWYETSSPKEQGKILEIIFEGARSLSEPMDLQHRKGQYSKALGIFGYFRRATRTDNQEYWQAFVDHTINVEQLLWAAQHNPEIQEAQKWQTIALSQIKTLGQYMSTHRNPGQSGTWQRGYFEIRPNRPNFGQFLFNEGKQGWRDDSTWSRGQAWWIYATCVTYQYTQDPTILRIAKEAINYYLDHLPDRFPEPFRRQGDLIPPWDFDYALQIDPDTEKDTSAAAIAVSGMLKLISHLPADDPDKQTYLEESTAILDQLMSSSYLATPHQGMSLLLHGCYHHPQSIAPSDTYDNGLIWGDYFLVDALITYQHLELNFN
jgi:hypothetical protein